MTLNRCFALSWLLLLVFPLALLAEDKDAEKTKEYVDANGLKTLIEPFKAPTMAELDKEKKWVTKPVVDAEERYRKMVEALPKPIPLEEARKLRNIDAKTNQEIISGFLRIPDDKLPANYDAVINRHMRADVKSTNPIMQNAIQEFDLVSLIGVALFGFDWTLDPFADALFVKSWESSEDGLCERIVLRDDLTWSDSKPFTAHDIVYSFRIIMCPEVPVPAVRSGTDEIRWIEAYDDQTLVIFHKKSLATNIWNCNFPIIPKHIYEKTWPKDISLVKSQAHRDLEQRPVVAGPYEIERRIPRQEIVLKRRPGFYEHNGKQVRSKPYFAEVRFKIMEDPNTTMFALKRGDLDEYEMSVTQWGSTATGHDFYKLNTKAREVDWTYFYFGWNNVREPFTDRRVREAMAYAYPHHVLLDGLNKKLTEPCLGQFHPKSPYFPKVPLVQYKQDLRKAAALLEEAGWIDSDGDNILDKEITVVDKQTGSRQTKRKSFDFTMICSNDPLRIATCSLMKSSLEKLGVRCTVQPLEQTVLFTREMEHDFDAYFGGWGSGSDPDTSDNIWTTPAIKDGRNFVSYSNKFVDGLYKLGKFDPRSLEERQKIYDEHKLSEIVIAVDAPRNDIYAKIHELIYLDQPTTFLYYRSSYFGFSKELLGYHFSPRGPYHYSPGFSSIWKAIP